MRDTIDAELLAAIAADPTDASVRMVYADWLEQRGDPRGAFIREHMRVAPLAPDHPDRYAGEQALSRYRQGLDPAWLAVIEPERGHQYSTERACDCFVADGVPELHREPQDTESEAWKRLLDYVERAAVDGTMRFQPGPELTREQWRQIVTLPPAIAKLTAITSIDLYGSHLVRIPREIGAMTSLRSFTTYTSYRLHWYPYEITRCPELRSSQVSTRALYGNFKFRPPFPLLVPATPIATGPMRACSVCDRPYEDLQLHRVWISLRVGTDVLPLLVNACSAACVDRLPAPPENYVPGPHRGGAVVEQPPGY